MSSLTPSIILQWSPRLTERQDAFVTFHNRASLSAAKEYPEVSAQVETPMGAPQPAGKPPTIDDPDVGQDKHILMEMQALYAKEIRSLKFIQPKLYAYIFLMLSAEAAAHVKSHISYADANLKKSPHLLLSIIHSLYNSDDADNSPQAAKAAALVSLANFKVLRGELLVTAADRLNRIADAARASKTVGDGVDDLTLAQLYMDGLPRPQFEEYIKVIDNTTSMDPTKAPRNTIELRTSLMKLGAPDKAGQGDDDAHSAMIASVHSEPPSPRPKAGYMCQGCGVHNPDHFPSECPSYTPAQRLILLNKHNERCNDRKKRSIERGGGQAGRAGRGNGKRAEGAAAASKSDAAPHAQRPAATKNKHPKDGPHIQAAAVDFELMAEKVAKKVASRVIQSLHTTEIAPDSDDDSVSGLVAQVECASIDTAAARWGKVQPDMHYYDTGATGHVAPAPHISGDIGFQGSPVRLTGVGGYESKITRRCSAVVRGTYATLVVPGSPSLLSASLLLLTHYVEVDRNGLYYVLEPRDVHEHDYLAFVKTGNGLYPLAEMYASGSASGDPMRRSWANEDVIRSAESNTAKAWRALIQRQVQSRVRVPSSTQVAMQIIACSALDSANVSASPVYTTTPPRPSIWSESPLKTSSMTASHSPKHKTEFALTTFAQKLANASDSIKSNVASHTLMQIQGAKLAELYLRTLGTSPENLSRMLSKGLISGALITTRDVSTAMDVFGPDPTRSAAWKRSRPPHVDIAPRMTRNNENNVQALDLFKVSGRQILISVFVPASIKMCSVLESKESHAILAAVISHRQDMLERGYKVNVIHSDKEPGLVSKENRKELANLGVRLAEYATEAHVVQIESNVAPTRKRIITLLATCVNKYGYSPPSAFLQPFLDHTCVMNAFAEKEAADGMTPGQNMYGRSVSAAECSFPPGSMCISVISKGAQKGKDVLRGEQVIYLACRASETGTAKVYSLATNKIVIREINELSPMPITQEAVHALNSIYDAERKEEKALIIPRLQLGSRERDIDLTELKIWRSVETDDLPIIIEAVPAPADAKAEAEPPLTCPEMKIHITEPQRIFDREPPPQGGFEGSPYNSGNVQDKLRKIIAIAAITRMETTRAACAFNISVEQAFAEFPEFAEKSITLELENILRRTFRPIDYVRIAKHQKIIPSKMFLKPKWTSSGEFDKLKCRLVGGGHRQNSEDFGDLSAPTLGLTALFALLAIAAFLGQHSKCADVPSAYLNAPLDKQDGPIYVRLDKKTSEIVVKMRPELAKLADPSGRIVGEVEFALYGLIQSAMLWYQHITGALSNLGFTFNEYEPCVMNRTLPDGTLITVGIFVDDMKFFSVSLALIDATIASLELIYGKLTVQEGDVQSYLGMTINTATKGQVAITMEKYVADVISGFNVTGTKSTPAKSTLLEVDPMSPPLSNADCDIFRSKVMRIYYLARRVRPDMLTAAAFLTRRTTKATIEDAGKLDHLLKYLNGTRELGITLSPGSSLQIYAFVDAAYGTHFDMKSHTGCIIQIGNAGGPAYCKSVKQTIVSKSSTEAELIAASDMSSQIIWLRNFMQAQGHKMEPAILLQDNMSTISLINAGRAKAEKSRHINVRYFWLRDRIEANEIIVEHKPTEDMLADALTKPLTGSLFTRMRELLLNNKKR